MLVKVWVCLFGMGVDVCVGVGEGIGEGGQE